MILAFQLDPEVAVVNGADERFGSKLEEILSYELRLIFMFMPLDETIVIPPTYWMESDLCVSILWKNVSLVEEGYLRFLMNEKDFQSFSDKKNYRYRRLLNIARFKRGYTVKSWRSLFGIVSFIVGKNFDTGFNTFQNFKSSSGQLLRAAFNRQTEIDKFVQVLERTQHDVFIWESVAEELKNVGADPDKAERSGLRASMDGTYLKSYADAGYTIPNQSMINHRIVVPPEWAGWCQIKKLDRIAKALQIHTWINVTDDRSLVLLKETQEWWEACSKIRNAIIKNTSIEEIAVDFSALKLDDLVKKIARIRGVGTMNANFNQREDHEIVGSVVFVVIDGLSILDSFPMASCMDIFNQKIKNSLASFPDIIGFPTISGAIFLVPDKTTHSPLLFIKNLTESCHAEGMPLRLGVHRGQMPLVRDLDGNQTPISEPVNVAARLAFADRSSIEAKSPFSEIAIFSVQFADYITEAGLADHAEWGWLMPTKRNEWTCRVQGKRNEKFDCLVAPKDIFPKIVKKVINEEGRVAEGARVTLGGCLIIAYDLPKFSDGDSLRLLSRFHDIVRVVGSELLRKTADCRVLFTPGGDGGIVTIAGMSLKDAFDVAKDIFTRLGLLSKIRTTDAATKSRIGIHYGDVKVVRDFNGMDRPVGASLFIADGLSSDPVGRGVNGVIFSEAFKHTASYGDDAMFNMKFQSLTPFESTLGTKIERFVEKQ